MESERCVFCVRTPEPLELVSSVPGYDLKGNDSLYMKPARLGFRVKPWHSSDTVESCRHSEFSLLSEC